MEEIKSESLFGWRTRRTWYSQNIHIFLLRIQFFKQITKSTTNVQGIRGLHHSRSPLTRSASMRSTRRQAACRDTSDALNEAPKSRTIEFVLVNGWIGATQQRSIRTTIGCIKRFQDELPVHDYKIVITIILRLRLAASLQTDCEIGNINNRKPKGLFPGEGR